jgi:hypothetical protein
MKLHRLLLLPLVAILSLPGLARGQVIDTPVGDDADPDALDRVAKSDVLTAATGGPVTRVGDHFEQEGRPYLLKGVNFELHGHPWNLWTPYTSLYGEIDAELDRARRLGANVVRLFVTGDNFGGIPAIYNIQAKDCVDPPAVCQANVYATAMTNLDDFLHRADQHGLKVLITLYDGLNTFRNVQYDPSQPFRCRGQIGNPYSYSGEPNWNYQNTSPDNNPNTNKVHGADIRPYRNHADQILTRTIPYTNRVFANDPRIFGWDVMNEPDYLFNNSVCPTFYDKDFVNAWVGWMARHIRAYTQAPITAGTKGYFLNRNGDRPSIVFDSTMMDYSTLGGPHSLWADLDFISIHWYQLADLIPTALSKTRDNLTRLGLAKPVVLEEIGQADSGWFVNLSGVCVQQQDPGCSAPDLTCNRNWVHDWTVSWSTIAKAYNVGAMVWTGSDFVRTGVCGPIDYNRWTNADFMGLYDGGGSLKRAGQAFNSAYLDTTCTRAAFRTRDGGHYLTAQNGGGYGSLLDASSTSIGPNSTFTLERHGDAFGLKILKNGVYQYVSANQGGASYISVDRTQMSSWESFGLIYLGYVSGVGDNAVAFRTWGYNNTPYYFSAANGGGSAVNADQTTIPSSATFLMVCQAHGVMDGTDDPTDN